MPVDASLGRCTAAIALLNALLLGCATAPPPRVSAAGDGLQVASASSGQPRLFAGMNTTCALVGPDRSVLCWGADLDGELSRQGVQARDTCTLPASNARPASCSRRPISLGISGVRDMSLGDPSCAVLDDGRVTCWGARTSMTGDEAGSERAVPYELELHALHGSQRAVAWRRRVFGLFPDGHIRCIALTRGPARE